MSDSRASHLIIAGVTRAASTSLFGYLADHPDVCRSTIKETRFFLGEDPHLPRIASYRDGVERYDGFFPQQRNGQVRLEATPDYLYDAEAAGRIKGVLPRPRVVVVLREPVARLISWFRFAKQDGRLPADLTLDDYVRQQHDNPRGDASVPQPLRAVAQGRYADYLPAWLEQFDQSELLVLAQGELREDPAAVMQAICALAGLDGSFYETYSFAAVNQSRATRHPGLERAYRGLIWRIKPWVHDRPMVRAPLRAMRRTLEPLMHRANRGHEASAEMSPDTRRMLEDFYADQPAKLAALTRREVWTW